MFPAYLTGSKYRLRIVATNEIGDSDPSNEVRIAMAALPAQPAAPTFDLTKSTLTSLFVKWIPPVGGDIPVDGYRLYMSEKGTGQYRLIYDGALNSATLFYNATGLQTGKIYSFYVIANNYNGNSP